MKGQTRAQAAGVPPELSARLGELQAQSRAPSREEIAEVVEQMMGSLQGDLSEVNLKIYSELEGLAKYILSAKREIAALRPDEITAEHLPTATDELDAIVGATEEATNAILQAMEALGNLTEKMPPEIADQVNDAVTQVYEACNFQDVTGQRITKVVKALKHIEDRVDGLVAAFGDEIAKYREAHPKTEKPKEVTDQDLLNGPQLPENASKQDDIDALLASFD
ncbi:MAG TPA: protein phosphatase CheZ [Dongiaceae bacterium]|nr:protein phosphatase CheZ [Dongiaceae bacterium]